MHRVEQGVLVLDDRLAVGLAEEHAAARHRVGQHVEVDASYAVAVRGDRVNVGEVLVAQQREAVEV